MVSKEELHNQNGDESQKGRAVVIGGGSWSAATYSSTRSSTKAAGKDDFDYSVRTMAAPPAMRTAAPKMVPTSVNKRGPFADRSVRECADNDDHPTTKGIVLGMDVTGSMRAVPRLLLERLPAVFGLVLAKGYLEHPAFLISAIGDATSGDRVPLQIGQFEADNRIDEDLTSLVLEGGGGGSTQESYELWAYFMAYNTHMDNLTKRGERGFAFIIGDEQPYELVRADQIEKHIGQVDPEKAIESVPTSEVFKALIDKYDVYLIRPEGASYRPDGGGDSDRILEHWDRLLETQHIIDLPNDTDANGNVVEAVDLVADAIALQIGIAEGTIDLDDGLAHLDEVGSKGKEAVGKALAKVGGGSGGAVAIAEGGSDLDLPDDPGVDRL